MTDGSGFDELVGVPAPDQETPASYEIPLDAPRRKLRRLEILSETAARLLGGQDPDVVVLPWLSAVLAADLEVQTCLGFVANPDGTTRLTFNHGLDEVLVREGTPAHPDGKVSGIIAATRKAVYLSNIQTTTGEREALIRQAGLRALVTEPLVAEGELLGTLSFGSRTRDHFDADELAFFHAVAHQVAFARRQMNCARQLAEREQRARQRLAEMETLNAELHHRVKNLLTTVQAIAYSTVRSADSLPEFESAFGYRLTALAKTHDLLLTGSNGATSLVRLLRSELDPYDGAVSRVRFDGPEVALGSEIAVPLGMAVHELTTNAAKYGALSNDSGVVCVSWSVDADDDGQRLQLRWVEEGGPAVSPPSRRGFGSQLLERVLGRQFGATVEREFAPQGLRVSLTLLL